MGLSLESATRPKGSVIGHCLTIPRQGDRIVFDYTELCEDLTYVMLCVFIFFPGVTTHCGCIFHRPVAGFSLLVFEVS
jgi:hypothetical protein